jgi:hypothetical protein
MVRAWSDLGVAYQQMARAWLELRVAQEEAPEEPEDGVT